MICRLGHRYLADGPEDEKEAEMSGNDNLNCNKYTETSELSLEEQEKLIEKYDSESAVRKLTGVFAFIVKWFAIIMAVYHIYTSIFGMMESLRHRAMHLLFVLPLCFMLYPISRKKGRANPSIWDCLLALFSMGCCAYVVVFYSDIVAHGGVPTSTDVIFGIITIILVLIAVRRVVGWQLAVLAIIFLAYAYFGKHMPGIFAHKGASIRRMIDHLYMLPEGIFSIALGTASTYIIVFVIFAAFLEKSGLGDLIKDISMRGFGYAVGGPAKVAVVTSALFGTISGSAAGNVVTTGSFTIPLMKSTGYQKEFAGAVEAVASTGGQLMPPIMGSAAFIMADYLGVSYSRIIAAAAIPALLYYAAVFSSVHLRAKKLRLVGVPKDQFPPIKETLKQKWHLTIPFFAVLVLLIMEFTPLYVGAAGIILVIICAAIKKDTRLSLKDILWALETGAKRAVPVSIACAAVGCVIGVCTLTGISTILGNYILRLGQGYLLLTLILVSIIAIIMGMGMPTTAVYILLVAVAAPILTKLEVEILVAHFFVFYFGLMANITPPVAIPAYAAAGIANANPSKTGWAAFKIAIPCFLIPFMAVYDPRVLLMDVTLFGGIYVAIKCLLGVFMISLSTEGFWRCQLPWWLRITLAAGGLGLLVPSTIADLAGIVILVLTILFQQIKIKKQIPES